VNDEHLRLEEPGRRRHGSSAGIGASLARELGKRGGKVVLAARRADKLEEIARSAGEGHLTVTPTSPAATTSRAIASAAIDRFGHVDAWVNNAGRGITRGILDLTDDDVDTMVRDNVKSVLYGMQAIVPHFKDRKRGHLVNVSSMLGRVPFASIRSMYCAAKAAMGSLTETMRNDLAKDFPEVRVTCFYPGVVTTDFGRNALGGGRTRAGSTERSRRRRSPPCWPMSSSTVAAATCTRAPRRRSGSSGTCAISPRGRDMGLGEGAQRRIAVVLADVLGEPSTSPSRSRRSSTGT